MKKDFISARPSGSEKNEPKVIGEVLNDYLRSNEPLAIAFRKRKAKSEAAKATEAEVETDQLFKNFFPDTHLNVDLKLVTREQGRIPVGSYLDGAITRDGENHFSFFQNDAEKKRLVDVTKECLEEGLKAVIPWTPIGDMGHAVHILSGSGSVRLRRAASRMSCCCEVSIWVLPRL